MLQNERMTNSQGTASNQDMEKLRLSELKNLKKKYNLHVSVANDLWEGFHHWND